MAVASGRLSVVKRSPSGSVVAPVLRRERPPEDCRRGEIKGWSRGAAGRHCAFLQAVDGEQLDGWGYALTWTLRDRPATAREWSQIRARFFRWLKSSIPGVLRGHWVVELAQRKRGGVPHLHMAVYVDHELTGFERWKLVDAWCRFGGQRGARHQGQHVAAIRPGPGWARYCAKHSARSGGHAQREGMPQGWERSGRLWGRWGDWPTRLDRWLLNPAATVQLKRLMRSHVVADAVISGRKLCAHRTGRSVDWRSPVAAPYSRGVRASRRVLRTDVELGQLRGLRVWIPESVMARMMAYVATLPGCVVAEIVDDTGGGGWWRRLMESREVARSALGLEATERPRGRFTVRPLESGVTPEGGRVTARQARLRVLRERWGLDAWSVRCAGPGCGCGRSGCRSGDQWPDELGVAGLGAPGGDPGWWESPFNLDET